MQDDNQEALHTRNSTHQPTELLSNSRQNIDEEEGKRRKPFEVAVYPSVQVWFGLV